MSKLENEFYKRFNNQKLSGDDFDAEGLWDDISNDLEAAPIGENNSFWGKKWFSIFGAVLIIGGAICFSYWKMSGESTLDNCREVVKIESNENIQLDKTIAGKEKITSDETLKKENIATVNPVIKKVNIQNSSSRFSYENYPASSQKRENQKLNSSPFSNNFKLENGKIELENYFRLSPNENDNGQTKRDFLSQSNEANSNELSAQASIDLSLEKEPSNSFFGKKNKINLLEKLPQIYSKVSLSNYALPEYSTADFRNFDSTFAAPSKWQVEVIGGVNLIDINAKSKSFYVDIAEARNNATKPFPGTSFGLLLNYKINKYLYLNSGAEYHQLQTKFDYIGERDIDVLQEDQLMKVWISETTGDTLNKTIADTLVSAKETRTVIHYNQFKKVSVPFEIGIRRNSGRLIYGLSTGIVLNFHINQTGKTLNVLNEIPDEEETIQQFEAFEIGLRLRPFFGFKFSEKIAISLQPQWMWSRTPEKILDYRLTADNHQFNLNLGLGYSF